MIGRFVLALGVLLSGAAAAHDLRPFQETGRSHVLHEDIGPAGAEIINVETYVPAACAAKACPLVFSLHGLLRNAEAARDNWVEA
ncbi:MAG: hypothetical protein ACK4VM_18695, partial [Bosea sp. (in: a-proteobacteria)]